MHIATLLAGYVAADLEPYRPVGCISAEARATVYARPSSRHCHYCSVPLTVWTGKGLAAQPKGTVPGTWRTLDHLVPRVAGGSGEPDNLVAACLSCNKTKADLSVAEFLATDWLAGRRRVVARHAARHAALAGAPTLAA